MGPIGPIVPKLRYLLISIFLVSSVIGWALIELLIYLFSGISISYQ